MKERRYREDYRLVTEAGADGAERTRAEYRGTYYVFPEGFSPRRAAGAPALLSALFWASALAWLYFGGGATRYAPALMPMLLGLLPAVYGCMGIFRLFTSPKRMTRLVRQTGAARAARAMAACAVCALVSCGGVAAYATRGGFAAVDGLPALACLAAATGAAASARIDRGLREAEAPEDRPAENNP